MTLKQEKHLVHSKPKLHFTADCWINDPCAPSYDARAGIYHIFYQTNPTDTEWGNMSWGHITSKDMLSWHVVPGEPALVPDQAYDKDGVFTGNQVPSDSDDGQHMSVVYSSIKQLPFHWSTPPYPRNAAGLAMASSQDGGRTWVKHPDNPIVQGEPKHLRVSGFRDPYVAEWPVLDQALGRLRPALYAVVSGGIEGKGPTSFLYEVDRNNPARWSYISPLVDVPLRFQPSKKWSGNFGINWECVNFLTLTHGYDARNFMIIGVEGDVEKSHMDEYRRSRGLPPRMTTAQLWMSGSLSEIAGTVKFRPAVCGILDHGRYYAANSFVDFPTDRRIVYGWLPEQDISAQDARRKGWNGALAIPREVFLLRIPDVTASLKSDLSEITSVERVQEANGTSTLFTLGVRPIAELDHLRQQCQRRFDATTIFSLPTTGSIRSRSLFHTQTSTWELETTIRIKRGCETVGFYLNHDEDLSTRTTVAFSAVGEAISVDRSRMTSVASVDKCPDSGPFTLFRYASSPREDGCDDGRDEDDSFLEKLRLRIFLDGDILEVFANDRFALATMIYSEVDRSRLGGITAFATGADESVVFEKIVLWDGLRSDLGSIESF